MILETIYKDIRNNIVLLVILTSAVITGCSSEDTMPVYEQQRITFTPPVVKGITRADNNLDYTTDMEVGVSSEDLIKAVPFSTNDAFRVFGARYNNADVTPDPWSGGTSEYTDDGAVVKFSPYPINGWDTQYAHYWHSTDRYCFSAYYPATITNCESVVYLGPAMTDKGHLHITGFTTPAMGLQYDLMFAPAVYDKVRPSAVTAGSGNNGYNGVNLVFQHALSSIHFKVRVKPEALAGYTDQEKETEAAKYKVNQITITGVYSKANFTQNCHHEKDGNGWKYVAVHNDNTGYDWWGSLSNPDVTYDFIASPISGIPHAEARDIKLLNQNNHIGFMIPQNLKDKQAAVVTVKWQYGGGEEKTSTEVLNTLTTEWKMGYRYTYTISFSGEDDTIIFSPSVDGMGTPDGDISIN